MAAPSGSSTPSASVSAEQSSVALFRYGVRIGYELRGPVTDLIAQIDQLDHVLLASDTAGRKYASALRAAGEQMLGTIDGLAQYVEACRGALEQGDQLELDWTAINAHIGVVAHDINGSLGVLMGYAELLALRTDGVNLAAHAVAQVIIEGVNPLSDAVETLRGQVPRGR